MKKLIVIVSILFSVNSFGQMTSGSIKKDTSYYLIGNRMNMRIKYNEYIPKESPLYNIGLVDRKRKKRRNDRIFSIVTGVVFGSISVWFFNGYRP